MSLDLASLDGDFDPAALGTRQGEEARPPAGLLDARVPNGFFTLTLPDGSHRTFRVHTQNPQAKFAPGKRVISLLIGPANTGDYERFGFVEADGVRVWKRYRDTKQAAYAEIVWEIATGGRVEGCELLVSKRCMLCNRELTTPESLERGIGPLCWERLNHG